MLLIVQRPSSTARGTQPFLRAMVSSAPAAALTPHRCEDVTPAISPRTYLRLAALSGLTLDVRDRRIRIWSAALVVVVPQAPPDPAVVLRSPSFRFALVRPDDPPIRSHSAVAASLSLIWIIVVAGLRSVEVTAAPPVCRP